MTDDPLARPLTFGDKEQIDALAAIAREHFWDALTNCPTCEGYGECERCGHLCEDCNTFGKTPKDYEKFEKEFPGWITWNSHR